MSASSIKDLVDRLDRLFGPDAQSAEIEKVAMDLLSVVASSDSIRSSRPESGPAVRQAVGRRVHPLSVTLTLPLSASTSRLLSTVRARAYDRVRQTATRFRVRLVQHFQNDEIHVPPLILSIPDSQQLFTGHSPEAIQEIVVSIGAAARDSGFDRVILSDLQLGGTSASVNVLNLLPGLFQACDTVSVHVNIGDTTTGISARDIYGLSLAHLLPEVIERSGILLSCNAFNASSPSMLHVGAEVELSVWPLLDSLRGELSADACYSDRLTLLAYAGRLLAGEGRKLLDSLRMDLIEESVAANRVSLAIDAPGEGPAATAIWAGFPITPDSGSAASRVAACYLRAGLLSDTGSDSSISVASDGLPLSYSLRNCFAFPADLTPAEFSAGLLELFSDALHSGRPRWVRMIATQDTDSIGVQIGDCAGLIPRIGRPRGWSEQHFSCGGFIVPPTGHRP